MPNLGSYGFEIFLAYAGSTLLLGILVAVCFRQSVKASQKLLEFGAEQ